MSHFPSSSRLAAVSKSPTAIAVVGAGVVGQAAALALARAGASTVYLIGPQTSVFDPSTEQPWDPRVFALSARSRELLENLAVWQAMPSARRQPVTAMDVWSGAGSAAGRLTFHAHDAALPALSWIVEQQSLLAALQGALPFAASIRRLPAALQGMRRRAGGWALHGDGFDLDVMGVIAADGAHSFVRGQAGLDFEVQSYNAEALVCTFSCEWPHAGHARQWFLDDEVLALLPLPGNHVSLVWSVPLLRAAELKQLTPAELAAAVLAQADGQVGEYYGDLLPMGKIHAYPLRHGVAPCWVRDGVVLVGDAAHQIHPLAGQGLNAGLDDIAELAERLAQQGVSSTGWLAELEWRRWERRRRVGFKPLHAVTDLLHDAFRVRLPGADRLRATGMDMLNRLPAVKRWLIEQAMRG
ncbi:MAG: FAD-dependent monooxygenase [Burkholderiaceae bacterium]|jgi:2-octaprenylphenol hydroxylase